MTYTVQISRKTTINSHSPAAYWINLNETDEPTTDRLIAAGVVDNDTVRMRGVFDTERDAVLAILGYVTASVAVVADTDWISGHEYIRLVQRNTPPPHGVTRRLLGTTSRGGIYLSN